MVKRGILVSLLVVALTAAAAHAEVGLHGRSVRAQAGLLADVVESGRREVQVLDQLCEKPSKIRRCSPIPPRLAAAFEEAVGRPVRWVAERRANLGEFWVLSPVHFGPGQATASYAWWGVDDLCGGGTAVEYGLHRGAWSIRSGIGWAWCTARA
jgi:hypothetical protein